ncbi:hypothetical protein DZC30_22760 [Comamonas testosteroni]|uniref:Uncharacterized protein n=1 Tax=Comamonas testosteroni TaxID=285 RepID=A0A373F0R7_COMTE|nr:hypothetical protein DZC30_22760 [Comamonas testosteroni]
MIICELLKLKFAACLDFSGWAFFYFRKEIMQIYKGMPSIREAQSVFSSAELRRLVGRRIKELIEYADFEDPTFFQVVVWEGVVAQMPVAAEVGSGDERDELGSG